MFSVVCDYSEHVAASKNNLSPFVRVVCDDVLALGTMGELLTGAGRLDVLKSLSEQLETLSNLRHVKTIFFAAKHYSSPNDITRHHGLRNRFLHLEASIQT